MFISNKEKEALKEILRITNKELLEINHKIDLILDHLKLEIDFIPPEPPKPSAKKNLQNAEALYAQNQAVNQSKWGR